MNGYDLAGKIRKIYPDASLVFVTNYDTSLKEGYEVRLKVFRTGVDLQNAQQIPSDGQYVDLVLTLAVVDAVSQ